MSWTAIHYYKRGRGSASGYHHASPSATWEPSHPKKIPGIPPWVAPALMTTVTKQAGDGGGRGRLNVKGESSCELRLELEIQTAFWALFIILGASGTAVTQGCGVVVVGGGGKQKKKGKCIQSDGTVNKRGGRSEDVWRLMNPWMRTLARHAQQKLWVSSTCDEEAAVSKCNKEGLFCFPPRRRHPLCFQQRKWVTGVCRVQVSVRSKLWPHGHQNPGPVPLTSSVSFSVYLYPNLHTSVPRLVDLVLRSRYRFAVNARR